jgi:hypothetical protein
MVFSHCKDGSGTRFGITFPEILKVPTRNPKSLKTVFDARNGRNLNRSKIMTTGGRGFLNAQPRLDPNVERERRAIALLPWPPRFS